ncbi:hypothetical protein Tdes44962_MAKER10344 [Teratosphaeria destructans]|uniref:Uncharacterized protein n=1 Tax=Teratosphaeria destructans TaxID=418781 RepID=A0A9W7SK48_9PEZI|nr:hypothetical protein Tdes44962_MAKER10344 [Teratosphaeria destructans]
MHTWPQDEAYGSDLLALEVGVQLLVAGGEDGVLSRVHADAVVPRAPAPLGARGVQMAHHIGIIGDEQVGSDAAG